MSIFICYQLDQRKEEPRETSTLIDDIHQTWAIVVNLTHVNVVVKMSLYLAFKNNCYIYIILIFFNIILIIMF